MLLKRLLLTFLEHGQPWMREFTTACYDSDFDNDHSNWPHLDSGRNYEQVWLYIHSRTIVRPSKRASSLPKNRWWWPSSWLLLISVRTLSNMPLFTDIWTFRQQTDLSMAVSCPNPKQEEISWIRGFHILDRIVIGFGSEKDDREVYGRDVRDCPSTMNNNSA